MVVVDVVVVVIIVLFPAAFSLINDEKLTVLKTLFDCQLTQLVVTDWLRTFSHHR